MCGNNLIDIYFVDVEDGCILSVPGITGNEEITIEEKPNGYGGKQLFFICPKCGARARFLYWRDSVVFPFVCRKCARLNYKSQQATKNEMYYYYKGMEYAEKHFDLPALHIDGFLFMDYLPDKPRGMHETKYRRYLKQFLKYRDEYTKLTLSQLTGLFKKWG